VIDYTCNIFYFWPMPEEQGCEIVGMLFTNPSSCLCTLKTVTVLLYNSTDRTTDTTGDLEITIYDVVGGWPPYIEEASVIVPNEDFVDGWTGTWINEVHVPIDPLVIGIGDEWVVGIATASAEDGDTLLALSDDASCGQDRSVCYNPWFDLWSFIGDEWQLDVNMHIYSTIARGCLVGDADGSGFIDIDDVVYLVAYIFSLGPAPQPFPVASGDANCDCMVDIDDVVYLLWYGWYPGGGQVKGPEPCTMEEWTAACGSP
jgi:hypothetical protein